MNLDDVPRTGSRCKIRIKEIIDWEILIQRVLMESAIGPSSSKHFLNSNSL